MMRSLGLLLAASWAACSSTPPIALGLAGGRLPLCPSKPNCVSSQASDGRHHVEPLSYTSEPARARVRLEWAIAGMARSRIIVRGPTYWHAEFRSPLFRFVDDLELLFDDAARRIDVRSASRLGYSDLGVNRQRVEEIRRRFSETR